MNHSARPVPGEGGGGLFIIVREIHNREGPVNHRRGGGGGKEPDQRGRSRRKRRIKNGGS